MIPLLHDFTNATVLIIGGGHVGARKARRFATEATVIVLSPEFISDSFGDATLIRTAPTPEDIPLWLERVSPTLVVAATNNGAVNEATANAAAERNILYNRADKAGARDPGSVVVPATVRDDPVVVAISSGARAPALSKYLRQELEETLEGAGEMALLCGELRERLKETEVPPARRREIVTEVVNTPAIWTALRTGTSNYGHVIEDVIGEQDIAGGERW